MKVFRYFTYELGLVAFLFAWCSCADNCKNTAVTLIPAPSLMEMEKSGCFTIDSSVVFIVPSLKEYSNLVSFVTDGFKLVNYHISTKNNGGKVIEFSIANKESKSFTSDEAYSLTVSPTKIQLVAPSDKGLYYGIQTLLQLGYGCSDIPCVKIEDCPRFKYRGMHIDVSRNFMSKEFLFKMIDRISEFKLNTLHLHLTDGAGWRMKLDRYPLLTKKAAFRGDESWKTWWEGDRRFVDEGDSVAYGGYYTKDELREVVSYAAKHFVNIIPEIEMPAHSEEVFVAYPEISCSGIPYKNADYCAGNEKTFEFLQNVLDEVMEVFPSEYIHIGGDEAGKEAWATCPKCQARMKKEGLKSLDELQAYFVRRIEKYLVSKGRKMIGWDEICEGELDSEATIMVWRDTDKALKAIEGGHDVVMTQGSHLYFDYYQADPETQPLAIGGYIPVKRVYSYNPIPDELPDSLASHVLGVQANLWTEYVPNEKHAEYMLFPRLLALAEVAWSPSEERDWQEFKPRLNEYDRRLIAEGVNAFPLSYEIETTMFVDTINKQIVVNLDAEKYPAEIRYTTNGTLPTESSTLYNGSIIVKDSANICAAIFENGKLCGNPTYKRADFHRGIGKKVKYLSRYYRGYMAGGDNALNDGYRGGLTYLDGRWQGCLNSMDVVVDMGEKTHINTVSAKFMQIKGPCVYQPGDVEVLLSDDGENYSSCGVVKTTVSNKLETLAFQTYTIHCDAEGRYVRIKASEVNGHQFLFADEIVIW